MERALAYYLRMRAFVSVVEIVFVVSTIACSRAPTPVADAPAVSATTTASSSAPSASSSTSPGDASPFVVATKEDALARVKKIPEAIEPLSFRAMGQVWNEDRACWITSSPARGCVAGARDCAWVVASGTPEKGEEGSKRLEYIDRTFFVDARTGEVRALYPEDWTDEDKARATPKPLAEWKRFKERQKRAWEVIDKLPEVKALKNLGYRTHPPEPYDCTADDARPCKFPLDVCDVGRNAGCEANAWDWIGRFTIDDATLDVTVDADELTKADGPNVSLARWRELYAMLRRAKGAIEKPACAGGHAHIVDASPFKRRGCKKGDVECAFELPVVLSIGEDAYAPNMTVDGKTFAVIVDTPSAVVAPMTLAAWCARVARGQEPRNDGTLPPKTPRP